MRMNCRVKPGNDASGMINFLPISRKGERTRIAPVVIRPYPASTASAPVTAVALSMIVRSKAPDCTVTFSAKKRASVT